MSSAGQVLETHKFWEKDDTTEGNTVTQKSLCADEHDQCEWWGLILPGDKSWDSPPLLAASKLSVQFKLFP